MIQHSLHESLSNVGSELASIRISSLCRSTASRMLKLYPDDFIERTVYHIRRILPLRVKEYIYFHNGNDLSKPTCVHIYHWTTKPDDYFNGNVSTEIYDINGMRHFIRLSYNVSVAIATSHDHASID